MRTISHDEFKAGVTAQGAARREEIAFKCPSCDTVQNAQSLINAGAGETMDEVMKYLGFSCVGRFDKEQGCNWTLGGLLQIHTLEVETTDGPRRTFELASPEETTALAASQGGQTSDG